MSKEEKFVEYSVGNNALPWIGWMEDQAGAVVGHVTLDGSVYRKDGRTSVIPRAVSIHTTAWNSVRDAVSHASHAARTTVDPPGEGEGKKPANYWPENPVACLLSLALREGDANKHLMGARWDDIKSAIRLLYSSSPLAGRLEDEGAGTEIGRLAAWLQENRADQIGEGSAVDAAIEIMIKDREDVYTDEVARGEHGEEAQDHLEAERAVDRGDD